MYLKTHINILIQKEKGSVTINSKDNVFVKKEYTLYTKEATIWVTIILLCLGIVSIQMIDVVLFTFIFVYLFEEFYKWIKKIPFFKKTSRKLFIFTLYLSLAFIGAWFFYFMFPIIGKELNILFQQLKTVSLQDLVGLLPISIKDIATITTIENYLSQSIHYFWELSKNIGNIGLHFFFSFLLSFFFLIEKEKIITFLQPKKEEGNLYDMIYKQMQYIGTHFFLTFGKVLQIQIIITTINAFLSGIALYLLDFPNVIGLTFMVFFLGFIPVAGVIISFIPLSIIAFEIGGWTKVLIVILFVLLIHAFESYVLNPKLMASKLELPIFFTFSILLIAQHFLQLWGLLIGVPMFLFLYHTIKNVRFDSNQTKIQSQK